MDRYINSISDALCMNAACRGLLLGVFSPASGHLLFCTGPLVLGVYSLLQLEASVKGQHPEGCGTGTTCLSTDPSVDGQAGRLHNQLDTVTGVNLQHTQSACSHPRPATMVPWTGRRNSILGEKRLFRGEGISSQLLSIQTLSWFFHNKCCKAITLPALLRSSMRISLRGFSQSHH